LSNDPDTILVPCGENATDVISRLCVFVFSRSSSSAPVG
jgi:cation transporter-like permease